ncbi:MAG: hypothetical protein H7833_00475 [Magnetococcus sp. DMHC-1]
MPGLLNTSATLGNPGPQEKSPGRPDQEEYEKFVLSGLELLNKPAVETQIKKMVQTATPAQGVAKATALIVDRLLTQPFSADVIFFGAIELMQDIAEYANVDQAEALGATLNQIGKLLIDNGLITSEFLQETMQEIQQAAKDGTLEQLLQSGPDNATATGFQPGGNGGL